MAEKLTYKVLREMQGDRDYAVGDTRELTATEAAQLVSLGVLDLVKGGAKAKPAAKADAANLKNKAEG